MPVLPELVWDDKTRISADAFLYYNPGRSTLLGRAVITNTGSVWVPEQSCAGPILMPASGFLAARLARHEAQVALSTPAGDFEFGDPIGSAIELADSLPDPETYTGIVISGGEVGDSVEVIALPNPDDDILICYDQGFEATEGATQRAIPRKRNPADHYVSQRGENTISMSELTVNNYTGLRKIHGRNVTLILKFFPDGTGLPAEISYFAGSRLSVNSPSIAAEANDSVTVSAEGAYNQRLVFAARPPE